MRNIIDFLSKQGKRFLMRFLVAICVIILATALRIWPLGALELRIPWVTFYPAVMAAALYGGFSIGLLATVLSVVVVLFWSPTGEPFINDPGDWLGLCVFCFNGTLISMMSGAMHFARKQAIEARQQAEAANQAKSFFLANMSHELRTPLNAILGFTNLIRKTEAPGSEQMRKLDIIINSGENLLNLINNVLEISKIEAGHVVSEESDINLNQLLHEIESLMSVKVAEKGLRFDMTLPPDLPKNVTLDQGKLRQVLTNLIANAVKYTTEGSVSLTAKLLEQESSQPSQQPRLRFEIHDTGIGLRQEQQEIIFAPFEQIGNQPANEAGTGLGLAICKQFVVLMGGEIGVTSEIGGGSVFHFEIPVTIAASSADTPHKHRHERVTGLAPGQPLYRLLIVDDKLENRLLLREILQPLGFELREAVNGYEAVQQFELWHPHLIWMDIRMPGMDGMEATQLIKASEAGRDTKVIAITAHALEEERLKILKAGCDDFIRKPYRDTEIFDTMARHLDVHFRYEQEKSNQTIDHFKLSPERLKTAAADDIECLRDAAVLLNDEDCLAIIETIGEKDRELGDCLCRMIKRLQYKEILRAIDALDEIAE